MGAPPLGDVEAKWFFRAFPDQRVHHPLSALDLPELSEGPPGSGDWGLIHRGSRHCISMGAPLLIDPPQLPRLCLSPALGPQSSSAPGMWLQPRWPPPERSIVGTSVFIFLLSFSRFLSLFCLTFILDWSIVDLLCCVCLRWIAAWFNHAYIYFFLDSFPMQDITECCVICNMYPMGYSGSFLMIYFMCVYIYMLVLVCQSPPPYLSFPPPFSFGCPNFVFYVCVSFFCVVDWFIGISFSDSTFKWYLILFIFLFLSLLHLVWSSLYPSMLLKMLLFHFFMSFPGDSDSKESACNAGDLGSVPGSGRSPGEGTGSHSSVLLENSMDRGAWWATVHGVAKSWTWLSD